jgi:aryl carrier-like protein
MNATATDAACRSCGAILSRYRANGEELCAPCARKAVEAEPEARILDPDELVAAVAGLLLLARALEPERRVHLRAELAERGVETDHVEVYQAVQKLRRRGMTIDADEREPGHRLVTWTHRFKRRHGPEARAASWRRRQPSLFRV